MTEVGTGSRLPPLLRREAFAGGQRGSIRAMSAPPPGVGTVLPGRMRDRLARAIIADPLRSSHVAASA